MNIILVRKRSGTTIDLNLSRSFIIIIPLLFLGVPIVSYYLGVVSTDRVPSIADLDKPENIEPIRTKLNLIIGSIYKEEIASQQGELDAIKQHNQENINTLTKTMAKLQAHIIRLDALGQRLIEVADLDQKAFNFDFEPSMGGSADASGYSENIQYSEFLGRLAQITEDIERRNKQLTILETLLIAEHFKLTSTPTGNPAQKGRISSFFGMRKDPFTGKKKMHKGIDVAGKSGSSVLATADGVVIRAGKKTGYGKLIEIDHGYQLSTSYGHNKTISVKVGDIVKQGQVIATMGSTGRSTGPHVHYEVLLKGRPVNPQKYVRTARK